MKTVNEIGYQKFNRKRKRGNESMSLSSVPVIDLKKPYNIAKSKYLYDKYQILLIRNISQPKQSILKLLLELNHEYGDVIGKSWTMENSCDQNLSHLHCNQFFETLTQHPVLNNRIQSFYASFIIQEDKKLIKMFLEHMPCTVPIIFPNQQNQSKVVLDSKVSMKTRQKIDISQKRWKKIYHTDPIWLFMGRNMSESNAISGRVEHTDSVCHSGTWHYQVCGQKVWNVRPVIESKEWKYGNPVLQVSNKRSRLQYDKNSSGVYRGEDGKHRLRILCHPCDILLINTRLWWHSTELPSTVNSQDQLSISFARDFYQGDKIPNEVHQSMDNSNSKNDNGPHHYMTNIEGLYAAKNVKLGDIVLMEEELPNCSLPRHPDANCMVVEVDDDTLALVARRDIFVGDWLTVLPSDDEEEDEEEENK